jgi:low temperature requirement protein LtrA
VVFTLVWIAWANGSLHYELHGREDARSRITFLVQILVLAVMGACIPAASGARGAAFAVATAVLFAILAGLWLRAGRGDRPEYRQSSRLYVAGTAAFAVLMACTALLPARARVPAWGLLDAAYLAVFGAVILTASAGASRPRQPHPRRDGMGTVRGRRRRALRDDPGVREPAGPAR